MTEAQELVVENHLLKIKNTIFKYEEELKQLRTELLINARFFDTYTEMYLFLKKHTDSLESFNKDMLDAREIWYASHPEEA